MTIAVRVTVPPHVHSVLIGFEKFENDAWTADGTGLVFAGNTYEFSIHEMRRICSIMELRADPAYANTVAGKDPPEFLEHRSSHTAKVCIICDSHLLDQGLSNG
jgi:hypothetical protein